MSQDEQEIHYWSAQCGRQIKALRDGLKLTQAQFGVIAGLTDQQISNIERGIVNIPTETLGKIARVLDVSPSQLYGDIEIRELGLRVWLRSQRPEMIKNLRQIADKLEVLSM